MKWQIQPLERKQQHHFFELRDVLFQYLHEWIASKLIQVQIVVRLLIAFIIGKKNIWKWYKLFWKKNHTIVSPRKKLIHKSVKQLQYLILCWRQPWMIPHSSFGRTPGDILCFKQHIVRRIRISLNYCLRTILPNRQQLSLKSTVIKV